MWRYEHILMWSSRFKKYKKIEHNTIKGVKNLLRLKKQIDDTIKKCEKSF